MLDLTQGQVLCHNIRGQKIGKLVILNSEKPGQLADLEVYVLPLDLRQGIIPLDKFAVIESGQTSLLSVVQESDNHKHCYASEEYPGKRPIGFLQRQSDPD